MTNRKGNREIIECKIITLIFIKIIYSNTLNKNYYPKNVLPMKMTFVGFFYLYFVNSAYLHNSLINII